MSPLNMSAWTPEEEAFIEANRTKMSRVQLAVALNRSRSGVANYLRRKKLEVYLPHRKWSLEETKQLLVLSEKYGRGEIAVRLKRDVVSVANKLKQLGVRTRTDVFSLRSASKYTGYNPHQLIRARNALKQFWYRAEHRGSRTGSRPMLRFRIYYEQLEALCQYLKTEPPPRRPSRKKSSRTSKTTAADPARSVTRSG